MNTLGLHKEIVKLVDHQDAWQQAFLDAEKELRSLIGDYIGTVEHVGSTAVKEIRAKPIIDVVVVLTAPKFMHLIIHILEENEYEYMGNLEEDGGHLFHKLYGEDHVTHHIHIIEEEDENQLSNFLYFKEELQSKPDLLDLYEELKERLAFKFVYDRIFYDDGKNDFIQAVLKAKE